MESKAKPQRLFEVIELGVQHQFSNCTALDSLPHDLTLHRRLFLHMYLEIYRVKVFAIGLLYFSAHGALQAELLHVHFNPCPHGTTASQLS